MPIYWGPTGTVPALQKPGGIFWWENVFPHLASAFRQLTVQMNILNAQLIFIASVNQKLSVAMTSTQVQSGAVSSILNQVLVSMAMTQVQRGIISVAEAKAITAIAMNVMQGGVISTSLLKPSSSINGVMLPAAGIADVLPLASTALVLNQMQGGAITDQLLLPSTNLNVIQTQQGSITDALSLITTALQVGQIQGGTITSALQKTTSAINGVMLPSAAIAAVLPLTTSALVLKQTQGGTIADVLPLISTALNVAQIQPGTMADVLPLLTTAVQVAEIQGGTIADVLPLTTTALALNQTQDGTIADILPQLVASLNVAQTQQGTIATSLYQPTTALAMLQSLGVAIADVLPTASTALNGYEVPGGPIADILPPVSTAMVGAQTQGGTIIDIIPQPSTALQGLQTQSGTMASALGQPGSALVANQTQGGAVADQLAKISAALNVIEQPQLAIAAALQLASTAITAGQTQSGVVADVLLKAVTSLQSLQTQSGTIASSVIQALTAIAANVVSAISPIIKGTTAAATTSVALPSHAVGDLIILHVYRNASSTQATVPTASGTVPAWSTIATVTGSTTAATRVVQFVATATNHTSGTFTNASNIIATVISGQYTSPIGAFATVGGLQTGQSTAPAIGSWMDDGSSLFLHFMSTATTNPPIWSAPPTGYTQQIANGRTLFITKDDTTTDGAVTNTDNGANSVGYTGVTVEILSANVPAAPAYDAVGAGITVANNASSGQFNVTASGAANEYAIVDVVMQTNQTITVTYDYGGTNQVMTKLVQVLPGNPTFSEGMHYRFGLANPPSGTKAVRVVLGGTTYWAANAYIASDVGYVGDSYASTNYVTSLSRSVRGGAGTLVVESLAISTNAGAPSFTAIGGVTNRWDATSPGGVDLTTNDSPMGFSGTATSATQVPISSIATVLYKNAPAYLKPKIKGANFGGASTTTVSIPAHVAGDLILIWAGYNISGFTVAPPTPGGTVPAWSLVKNTSTGVSSALYSFVATANNHTSGTWGNVTDLLAIVISGQASGSSWLGDNAIQGNASSANVPVPAITPGNTDGSSLILQLADRNNTTSWLTPAAGYSPVWPIAGGTDYIFATSKDDSRSDGAVTHVYSAAQVSATAQVEIKSH